MQIVKPITKQPETEAKFLKIVFHVSHVTCHSRLVHKNQKTQINFKLQNSIKGKNMKHLEVFQ